MKYRCVRLVQSLLLVIALSLLTVVVSPIGTDFEISSAAGRANIFYVALSGDDAAVGDLAHPWRTFKKAAATLVAGDTVYIRAGTYFERLLPVRSGTENNWIRYMAYPGEEVTLDGTGVSMLDYYGVVEIFATNYIQVSGLHVIHSSFYGIDAKNSSYIILDNNYTYDTVSAGIASWGNNHVLITQNEVVAACTTPNQEDLVVSNTDTFEVSYNRVHDVLPGTQGQIGIAIKDNSKHGKIFRNTVYNLVPTGIYINSYDGYLFDIDLYENVVYNIEQDGLALASEKGGLLENVRVFNNISYDNLTGLWISSCCTDVHRFKDIYIYNNTFYHNGNNVWGVGIGIDTGQFENVILRNNISSQNVYAQIVAVPEAQPFITSNNNLTDGPRNLLKELYGVGDLINVSPLFVNPAARDLHLSQSSPAIDAGYAQGAPPTDFEGDFRPQDGNLDGTAAFDIGADEFSVGTSLQRVFLPLMMR